MTPRGGRDAVDGWALDEAGLPILKVRVRVAPEGGAANAAVVALLAKALELPRSAVRVAAGQTARIKRLEIDGVGEADLARAFGQP